MAVSTVVLYNWEQVIVNYNRNLTNQRDLTRGHESLQPTCGRFKGFTGG